MRELPPAPGIRLPAITREPPSQPAQSYRFLPPGQHAELLVVRFFDLNDLTNSFAIPTPMMMLQVPLHSQTPGESMMMLAVGPKRKRTFTCPNVPPSHPPGSNEGSKPSEVMANCVRARKVYRESIDRVQEIIRSLKCDQDMTSVEWCLKVMAICDQEGCFVKEPC